MTENINVIATGSATPIGWSSGSTYFSQLAGFSRFSMWRDMENPYSDEIKISNAEYLIDELTVAQRIDSLLTDCIKEALEDLKGKALDIERFPVYIGLPSLRPGLSDLISEQIKERVERFINNFFNIFCPNTPKVIECAYIPKDNIAGLLALKECKKEILNKNAELCLALAVDSYISPNTLQWLKATNKANFDTNKWGFVPGESSASVLLASDTMQSILKMESLGSVHNVVEAIETKTPDSGLTCLGETLTNLVEMLFHEESLQNEQIDKIYIDLNGDRARSAEFGFAIRSLGNRFRNPNDFVSTISTMGHLGAAYGLVLFNLAIMGGLRGYVEGPNSLVITGNETGERVIALIKTKVEESKYHIG